MFSTAIRHSNSRVSSLCLNKRFLATASASPLPHTAVAVGVLLKRNPLTLPELTEFQRAYYAYRESIERSESAPFDYTFYFKKGSMAEQRWLAAQAKVTTGKIKDGKPPILVQPQDDELIKLVTAKNISSADADFKSLNRIMQRSVYLVVKQASDDALWRLPSGDVLGDELLHEAASARLVDVCGAAMDTWFVGKTPVGHVKADHLSSKKIFYMKAHIISGKIIPSSTISDFAWMTSDELANHLDPAYYAQVSDMFSDV